MYDPEKIKKYWADMFKITSERLFELEECLAKYKAGGMARGYPIHLIESSLKTNKYLNELSYLETKGLQ